jgi:hypothetical protein
MKHTSDAVGKPAAIPPVQSLKDLVVLSRLKIRERLENRPPRSVADFLRGCGIPGVPGKPVNRIIAKLTEQLGIPIEKMDPHAQLSDELSVKRSEFDDDVSTIWATAGFQNVIEPYAYDFLAITESVFDKRSWHAVWKELGQPHGDDAIVNALMRLKVREFLQLFTRL